MQNVDYFVSTSVSLCGLLSALFRLVQWHRGNHHDDVIKRKHFPRYWPFVRGIHRPPVNSPHKGQWRGALMIPLIRAWINGWVNAREAGDLKRHRAHYDVSVMESKRYRWLLDCLKGLVMWTFGVFWGVSPVHSKRMSVASKRSNCTIALSYPWWRHSIETFSTLLAICVGNSPVTGEFHAQRPVTRRFDVFFDLRLNNRLSKQSWGW